VVQSEAPSIFEMREVLGNAYSAAGCGAESSEIEASNLLEILSLVVVWDYDVDSRLQTFAGLPKK